MPKKSFVGVNGIAKNIPNKGYVGINGVAKKLIKGYVGVNNVAKLFWDSSMGTMRTVMRFQKPYVKGMQYDLVTADIKTTVMYIINHGLFLMPEETTEYYNLSVINGKMGEILEHLDTLITVENAVYVIFQVLYNIPYLTVVIYDFNIGDVTIDDYFLGYDTLMYAADLRGDNYTIITYHIDNQSRLVKEVSQGELYPYWIGEYLDPITGIPYSISNIGIKFERIDDTDYIANFVFDNETKYSTTYPSQWFSKEDENLLVVKSDPNGLAQILNNDLYLLTVDAYLDMPKWFFYKGRYIVEIEIKSYSLTSTISYSPIIFYLDCSTISASLQLVWSTSDLRWVFVNGNYDRTDTGITDINFFSGKTLRLKFVPSTKLLYCYVDGDPCFTANASKLFDAWPTKAEIGSERYGWYTIPQMYINAIRCLKNKNLGQYQKLIYDYNYQPNTTYTKHRAGILETLEYSMRKTVYFNKNNYVALCNAILSNISNALAYVQSLLQSSDNTVLIQTYVNTTSYLQFVLYVGSSNLNTLTIGPNGIYPWSNGAYPIASYDTTGEVGSRIFIRVSIRDNGEIDYFNTTESRYQRSNLGFWMGNYNSVYSSNQGLNYLNYISNIGVHFENFDFEDGVIGNFDFTRSLYDKVDGVSPLEDILPTSSGTYIDANGLHLSGSTWEYIKLPSWYLNYGNTIEVTIGNTFEPADTSSTFRGQLFWCNGNQIVINYYTDVGYWKIRDNQHSYGIDEVTTISRFDEFKNSVLKIHFDNEGYIYLYKNDVLLYKSTNTNLSSKGRTGNKFELFQGIILTVTKLKVYYEE